MRKMKTVGTSREKGMIRNMIKKLPVIPFHPIFITLYSILSFLAYNLAQSGLSAANRLLIVLGIGTLLLLTFISLFMRDIYRAGTILTLFLIIFYSYGHVKELLRENIHPLARNVILFPVALALFLGGLFLLLKLSREKLKRVSFSLNMMGFILVLFPVVSIIQQEIRLASTIEAYTTKMDSYTFEPQVYKGQLPDIYFIVLDGYARSDIIKQETGLDNTSFLDGLRQLGFYVADCSMSNYAQTEQSLASTFNMSYLDNLYQQVSGDLTADYFAPYIKHSQVRTLFESLGYKTVSFYTGYSWAQWEDATYFIGNPDLIPVNNEDVPSGSVKFLTPYESTYIKTTLVLGPLEIYQNLIPVTESGYSLITGIEGQRSVVLSPLNDLPEISKIPGPKFVFLHLLLPHPPYVFGPEGEAVQVDMTKLEARLQGYRDQVSYADKRILPLVNDLISQAHGNIILFLEGDHGLLDYASPLARMANLNAYYFPDQDYQTLYPRITPVNSFRVLLTQYFGQNYPMLEDRAYFSTKSNDRDLQMIPNTCERK